jgi:hypothetical protein
METVQCTRLDNYLSESMDFEERREFELHLANCSICKECKSKSQVIEDFVVKQYSSVFMRPEFQEQVLALLRDTNGGELVSHRNLLDESTSESLESPMVLSTTHNVTLNRYRSFAIGASILAALILGIRFSISKHSIDEPYVAPKTNGTELAQSQIGPSQPSQMTSNPPVAIIGSPGFLCVRVESDDPDIEFYVVRPTSQRN